MKFARAAWRQADYMDWKVRARLRAENKKASALGGFFVFWRKGRDCALPRQLSAVQNRSRRFCRTLCLGFGPTPRAKNKKASTLGGLFVFWRKGRDCAFAIPGRRAVAPAIAVQNRSPRFCRTLYLGFEPTPRAENKKASTLGGLFVFWRKGRDSNPRRAVMPSTDFESVPL